MPSFDRHQPIGRLPSLPPAPLFPARHVQSHVSLSPPQEHIAGVGVLAADAGHHTAAYEPVSQQDRSPQKGRSPGDLSRPGVFQHQAKNINTPIALYDRTDWFHPIDQE
jgi:hypothetical protein